MKIKAVFLFDHFGPYHMARMRRAAEKFDLLAVEFGALSSDYAWQKSSNEGILMTTINELGESKELHRSDYFHKLKKTLDNFKPNVVFVPGWSARGALLALLWCVSTRTPAVMMSDSTIWDEKRFFLKELIKKIILNSCSAAFVAGGPQADYLVQLGVKRSNIYLGYDVVDNQYFESESKIKREDRNISTKDLAAKKYFLASARFVPKKNLLKMIEAYSLYQKQANRTSASSSMLKDLDAQQNTTHWDLVILGDGPLREEIEKLRAELGLLGSVHLPGFKEYNELPSYYAHAGAFVHASTTEQWGLVVNEAMASGLPVLVSNQVGSSPDLVKEGSNGWTFDPLDIDQLAFLMWKIASDAPLRTVMGAKSREIIANWSLERFLTGAENAAETAIREFKQQGNYFLKLLLLVLSR